MDVVGKVIFNDLINFMNLLLYIGIVYIENKKLKF